MEADRLVKISNGEFMERLLDESDVAEDLGTTVEEVIRMREAKEGPECFWMVDCWRYKPEKVREYVQARKEAQLLLEFTEIWKADPLDITPRSDSFFIPSSSIAFTVLVEPDAEAIPYLLGLKNSDHVTLSHMNPYMRKVHVLYVMDTLYRSMFFRRENRIAVDFGMATSAYGGTGRFIALPYTAFVDTVVGGIKFVPDRDAVDEIDFSWDSIWKLRELIQPAKTFLKQWDLWPGGLEGKPGIWLDWGRLEWLGEKYKLALAGKHFSEWQDYKPYVPGKRFVPLVKRSRRNLFS